MAVLRIEHPVADLTAWREASDRDPLGRERSGLTGDQRTALLEQIDAHSYGGAT